MAARLLVRARDSFGSGVGQYKKGDVVVVKPFDHVWGRLETLPNFIQIDVSDEDFKNFLTFYEEDFDENGTFRARRKVKLNSEFVDDIRDNRGGRRMVDRATLDTKVEDRNIKVFQALR